MAVFLSTRILMITTRPATVHLEVDVDGPHMRNPDDDRLFALEKQITGEFLRMEGARAS